MLAEQATGRNLVAVDIQRAYRNGRHKTNVPFRLQSSALHHPSARFYEWTGPRRERIPHYFSSSVAIRRLSPYFGRAGAMPTAMRQFCPPRSSSAASTNGWPNFTIERR